MVLTKIGLVIVHSCNNIDYKNKLKRKRLCIIDSDIDTENSDVGVLDQIEQQMTEQSNMKRNMRSIKVKSLKKREKYR